jgi:CRP-like cAMP-binding protein
MSEELVVAGRFKPHRSNCRNALLQSLADDDLAWLLPQFTRVPLRRRGIVQFSNSSMNDVYFIESGLISVLADTGKGKSVETRMIGPEGFIGIRVVLGKRESCHRRMVQVPGHALRMNSDKFAEVLEQNKYLHKVMLEYVHTIVIQTSQLNACNAHHSVQQRLARWLLMALDRGETDAIPITQKMLAGLLGVRRASVGECVAELEAKGIVELSRSLVKVVARRDLEDIACKCYSIISNAAGN